MKVNRIKWLINFTFPVLYILVSLVILKFNILEFDRIGFFIGLLLIGFIVFINLMLNVSTRTLTLIKRNANGYDEYENSIDGSVLIYIPAGEFTMGSWDYDDEKPVHKVYLDGYYIMKYEVTNKQYKKFCDETGRSYPPEPRFDGMSSYFTSYPDYPVVNVSWNDAKAYCDWADLRLPTEAEWEKAARGTDGREYPWGNENPGTNRCNYEGTEDGYKYTSPVGSYENGRSPYGCYDMSGNVWEWCNDRYGESYYRTSKYKNPKGPNSGSERVLRGGSWYGGVGNMRTADRGNIDPAFVIDGGGFRCAASE
ncbi:MAG: formylglycine-generating enzyme family protein [bacterium]